MVSRALLVPLAAMLLAVGPAAPAIAPATAPPAAALPATPPLGALAPLPVLPRAPGTVPGPPAEAASADREGRWAWPLVPRPRIVRVFDMEEGTYGPGHRGLDLAGSGAVRAPADGIVHFAGMVAGRPVLSIRHADGLVSSFDPVTAAVAAGDPVERGQVVGTLGPELAGASHCAPALCLHVGARRGGVYIDPAPLFGVAQPSVLKPVP